MSNVIVQLRGGLGNQLFQYAAGRALSNRDKVPLKFDISSYKSIPDRSYSLSHFNIRAEVIETAKSNQLFIKSEVLAQIEKLTRRLLGLSNPNHLNHIVRECHFHFDPKFFQIKSPVYLIGYWQSERYFHEIREIILKELTLCEPLNSLNLEFSKKIQNSTSINVHVRRGDYISNPQFHKIHGFCGLDYYSKALEFIVQRLDTPHFFVFSDDINWACQNLSLPEPVNFVDINDSNKAYLDLNLMSQCHHHIIANSSFSWWGAWLSNKADKIVIAPQRWFNESDRDTRDLIPSSWISL